MRSQINAFHNHFLCIFRSFRGPRLYTCFLCFCFSHIQKNLGLQKVKNVEHFIFIYNFVPQNFIPASSIPSHQLIHFCGEYLAGHLTAFSLIRFCDAPAECIFIILIAFTNNHLFGVWIYKYLDMLLRRNNAFRIQSVRNGHTQGDG